MPDAPKERLWTVSQLTNHLKDALEEAFPQLVGAGRNLQPAPASSGHVYFNLKDKQSILRTVMWRSDAQRLRFQLQDGLQVIVHGRLTALSAARRLSALRPIASSCRATASRTWP